MKKVWGYFLVGFMNVHQVKFDTIWYGKSLLKTDEYVDT